MMNEKNNSTQPTTYTSVAGEYKVIPIFTRFSKQIPEVLVKSMITLFGSMEMMNLGSSETAPMVKFENLKYSINMQRNQDSVKRVVEYNQPKLTFVELSHRSVFKVFDQLSSFIEGLCDDDFGFDVVFITVLCDDNGAYIPIDAVMYMNAYAESVKPVNNYNGFINAVEVTLQGVGHEHREKYVTDIVNDAVKKINESIAISK